MAVSVNGYITYGEDNSDWVSETDWQVFDKLKNETGIMVMGSKTFEQFQDDFPLGGALNVVMTHKPDLLSKQVDGVLFTDKAPKEVVEMVKEKGYGQLMLIGGRDLNTSFQKDRLINEIWLDIHPVLFGDGKAIFDKINLFQNLSMIGLTKLDNSQVLVKYKLLENEVRK